MRTRLNWAVLSILPILSILSVLVFAAGSARAAEDPPRAKELFQQGTTFFDLGQFDKAIEAWQEGYKAKPDPGFLYNIAQAYRLAGDAQKAIFFYRGYLRNSPKAHNRAEVEQKIAALQKQSSDAERPKTAMGLNGAAPPATAQPPALRPEASAPSAPGAPPSAVALSSGGAPSAPVIPTVPPLPAPEAAPSQPEPTVVAATASLGSSEARPFDLSAGAGTQFWTSGVQGAVQPSFALALAAGYTIGGGDDAVRFRLGAFFGYTSLSEPTSKETFTSLLVDPSLRVRLLPERLFLTADLGLGVMVIGGLKSGSALLDHTMVLMVNGAQTVAAFRPALGLEVRLHPSVALFAGPAIDFSPKKAHFHAAITRVELLAGVTFRL